MGLSEQKEKTARYMARLREMYASPQFKIHNVFPTMSVTSIYAVIAMCLLNKVAGMLKAMQYLLKELLILTILMERQLHLQ